MFYHQWLWHQTQNISWHNKVTCASSLHSPGGFSPRRVSCSGWWGSCLRAAGWCRQILPRNCPSLCLLMREWKVWRSGVTELWSPQRIQKDSLLLVVYFYFFIFLFHKLGGYCARSSDIPLWHTSAKVQPLHMVRLFLQIQQNTFLQLWWMLITLCNVTSIGKKNMQFKSW